MARTRPPLVLATGNPGKVRELEGLLGEHFEVRPRPADLPETVEDGATLEANAHKKASEVADHTGTVALADDTGLFVAALNGRPGVRSARYAGSHGDSEANRAKMLSELDGAADRRAYFETVIVVCSGDGRGAGNEPVVARGRVDGTITTEPHGAEGFGYDPIFVPDDGDGRTFAEMSLADKQTISHRGRALAALCQALGLD